MSVNLGVRVPDFGLWRDAATPFRYPGGEWHLKDIIDSSRTPHGSVWIAQVNGASVDELVLAALFAQVAHSRQQPFVLLLPYLPAARSDRGEPTGAVVYADLVRSMNPQQVIGIDAHSTVIEQLMAPKLTALDLAPLVRRAVENRHLYRYIIAPDEGAVTRALQVKANLDLTVLEAKKHRDFETGKITGIIPPEDMDPNHWGSDANYLVVDDICDGGGTFMGLAKELGLPKERLGLWVTHGIFSGKAGQLRSAYEHIYTTNSHPGHASLDVKATIVPCEAYMFDNIKESFS